MKKLNISCLPTSLTFSPYSLHQLPRRSPCTMSFAFELLPWYSGLPFDCDDFVAWYEQRLPQRPFHGVDERESLHTADIDYTTTSKHDTTRSWVFPRAWAWPKARRIPRAMLMFAGVSATIACPLHRLSQPKRLHRSDRLSYEYGSYNSLGIMCARRDEEVERKRLRRTLKALVAANLSSLGKLVTYRVFVLLGYNSGIP